MSDKRLINVCCQTVDTGAVPVASKSERITVRLPKQLLDALKEFADKHGYMDLSEAIRDILREKLLK